MDIEPIKFSQKLLEEALHELEEGARHDECNTGALQAVGSAAKLLGEELLTQRVETILRTLRDSAFYRGAIANFLFPKKAPPQLRALPSREELERDHPVIGDTYLQDAYANEMTHVRQVLDGQTEQALLEAKSDIDKEEILLTLAVMDHVAKAKELAHTVKIPDFRIRGVLFVCVIEQYRRGRVDDGYRDFQALLNPDLDPWMKGQLALGVRGRVPWIGYPYPDW